MNDKVVNTTIEILGKLYPIRCLETELNLLQEAAKYLHQKMTEVQESGKAINLERIAIITGLNIACQFLQLNQQKESLLNRLNQRITRIQDKLDTAVKKSLQTELMDTIE